MQLQPIHPNDFHSLKTLLAANGLCHEDLAIAPLRFFKWEEDGALIAIGGWEGDEQIALLRSVVVVEDRRNSGQGRKFVEALISQSKQEGIGELYLLTDTAEGFFKKLGFQPAPRSSAPEAIRQTYEFREHCQGAAFMHRSMTA